MPRLPVPGSDEGTWGSILNDFLNQAHTSSGALKPATGSYTGGIRVNGDLGGSATSPTVTGLRGRSVASSAPTDGQILAWNQSNSRWEPTTGAGGSLTLEQVHDDLGNTSLIAGTGMTKTYNDGANTITLDIDEPFTGADRTKLDGIEANATADQTAAEIKTAYESNANTNAFTDAEQTKLSGIEANAKDDQSASEVPITDTGSYFTATDVEGALQELGAGGGGSSFLTFTVAAFDAPSSVQAAADYVCDGTDDQVQIQEAIDDAFTYAATTNPSAGFSITSGVRIRLSSGLFRISSPITIGNTGTSAMGLSLVGEGDSTRLEGQGAANSVDCFVFPDAGFSSGEWHMDFEDFATTRFNRVFDCFHPSTDDGLVGCTFRNLFFYENSTDIRGHFTECQFINNHHDGSTIGIEDVHSFGQNLVKGCYFYVVEKAIFIVDPIYWTITGNQFYLCDEPMYMFGDYEGVVISGNTMYGIASGSIFDIGYYTLPGAIDPDLSYYGTAGTTGFVAGLAIVGNTMDCDYALTIQVGDYTGFDPDTEAGNVSGVFVSSNVVSRLGDQTYIDVPATVLSNQFAGGLYLDQNSTYSIVSNNVIGDYETTTSLTDDSSGSIDFGSGNWIDGTWNAGTNGDAYKITGRDVNSSAPVDGEVLTWNNSTSEWEPQAPTPSSSFLAFKVAASNAPASVKAAADYVCDGTDDDVEIQAAFNAANDYSETTDIGGATVYLSEGDYYLTSAVELGIDGANDYVSVSVRGQGAASTILHGNAKGHHGFIIRQSSDGQHISGLRMEGFDHAVARPGGAPFGTEDYFLFHDCYLYNNNYGIVVQNSQYRISNCIFEANTNYGVWLYYATYSGVSDCQFYYNGDGDILCTEMNSVKLTDNVTEGPDAHIRVEEYIYGGVISGATMNYTGDQGIVIDNGNFGIDGLVISGCNLSGYPSMNITSTAPASTFAGGIVISGNNLNDGHAIIDAPGLVVTGNQVPVGIEFGANAAGLATANEFGTTDASTVGTALVDNSGGGMDFGSGNFVFGSWQGGSGVSQLDDLSDVDTTGKTDGQVLTWNNSTSQWEASTVSGGGNATQIQSRNVSAAAPSNGQTLTWNNSTSQWEPQASAATVSSGWNFEDSFPEGDIAEHSMVSFGNDLYVIGGYYDTPGDYSDQTYRYNTLTDTWTLLPATLPFLAGEGAAVSNGTYIYYVGDYGASQQNTTLRLDPASPSSWTSLATMPEARSDHAIAFINGNIYVTGGYPGGAYAEQSIWRYNIAGNNWVDTLTSAPANYVVEGHAGTAYNNLFYTFGYDVNTEDPLAYYYDPVGDSWTQIASPPVSLFGPTTVVVGTEIWLIAGYNVVTSESSNVVAAYDPAADTWRSVPSTPTDAGADYAGAAAIGSTAYILGGYNNTSTGMSDSLYSSGSPTLSLSDISDVAIINNDDPGTVLTVNNIGVWEAKSPFQEIVFSQAGALTASTSPRYTTKRKQTLKRVIATLDTAGSSNTVINVLRGVTNIGTITITSGSNYGEVSINQTFYDNPSFYYLRMQVATVGTGAQNLTVQARFE